MPSEPTCVAGDISAVAAHDVIGHIHYARAIIHPRNTNVHVSHGIRNVEGSGIQQEDIKTGVVRPKSRVHLRNFVATDNRASVTSWCGTEHRQLQDNTSVHDTMQHF